MKNVFSAVVLGFFLGIVWGCGQPTPSKPSCDFPHKGDGGVFDQKGNYVKDAALVWVDVADNCFAFVNDPDGIAVLNTWINNTQTFNIAMQKGDMEEAFKLFNIYNDCLKDVAPYITNCELSWYFRKVHKDFGVLLGTKNIRNTNQYLVDALPQFKAKLGC